MERDQAVKFMHDLLRAMVTKKASDLFITAGFPPAIKLDGKMTPVSQYRFQGRGGSGVKAAQLTAKTGDIVGGCILQEGDEGDLICISRQGQAIRMRLSDIPSRGRATQGVIVMRLKARDKVATMSVVMEDKDAEEAVLEAAEDQREIEVERIKSEERRVKRAATLGRKGKK